MNINDLPDELKALALLRHKENPMRHWENEDKHKFRLEHMFYWKSSAENHAFWSKVNHGHYDMEDIEYARGIVNIDCPPLLFN